MPAPSLVAKSLFGGCISLAIPEDYIDVSDLRQVPDNQEVYVQKEGNASIIVEIVEIVTDEEKYIQNVEYYLWDLLGETQNVAGEVVNRLEVTRIPIGPEGEQREAMVDFIECNTADQINLKMALIRIPIVDSDILITMNRQEPSDFGRFKEIVDSFALKDWKLFLS